MLSADLHRPELEDGEGATREAHPLLQEEDCSRRRKLDRESDGHEDRRQQGHQEDGEQQVEDALAWPSAQRVDDRGPTPRQLREGDVQWETPSDRQLSPPSVPASVIPLRCPLRPGRPRRDPPRDQWENNPAGHPKSSVWIPPGTLSHRWLHYRRKTTNTFAAGKILLRNVVS